MERVKNSLQKSYKKQLFLIFLVLIFVSSALALWVIYKQITHHYQVDLSLHHQATARVFNSYLKTAEYEIKSTAQVLLYNDVHNHPKKTLDVLFDQHSEFLSGGLDFFYLDWNDETKIIDTRAKLFFDGSFEELTNNTIVGDWTLKTTENGNSLLVYKESLTSKSDQWQGYLYGFISLKDNVALVNSLLIDSDIDSVKLLSLQEDVLLSGARSKLSHVGFLTFYEAEMSLINSSHMYILQITKFKGVDAFTVRNYLIWFFSLLIILSVIYVILSKLFFTFLQRILLALEQDSELVRDSTYQELYFLQRRINENNAKIDTQLNSFELLMDATSSVVIFCDDTASVKKINKKAQSLFTESMRSRTVFDFMPVACHPSIQQALKGAVGITFETTLANINSIYHWQLFPYVTENSHRGVALIGSDVTVIQQLEWQLGELQQHIPKNSVESQLILTEFEYILSDVHHISYEVKKIWLESLIYCLNALALPVSFSTDMPLGELISQQLSKTPCEYQGMSLVQVECSINSASVHGSWPSDVGVLINTLILMAHSSNTVARKYLSIDVSDGQIKFEIVGVSSHRLVFKSLVDTVTRRLGIESVFISDNQLVVLYPFIENTLKVNNLAQGLNVAWIKNDYSKPKFIDDILVKLECNVIPFSTSESFFTELSDVLKIDVLLIGYNEFSSVLSELPSVLKTRLRRDDLPIGWIGKQREDELESFPNYYFCPHEYGLMRFLEPLIARPFIDLRTGLMGSHGWLIVGGSTIGRAILYEELCGLKLTPYLVQDINEHQSLFSNNMVRVVLLLDNVEGERIIALCKEKPELVVLSLDETVTSDVFYSYLLEKPYQQSKIKSLVRFVNKKISAHDALKNEE